MAIRREHKGGAAPTQLATLMAADALTFTVVTGGGNGYPTGAVGPFYVCLGAGTALEEKILCSTRAGDVFNIAQIADRGEDDTLAVEHPAGSSVIHVFTAIEADEANAHLMTGVGVHGRSSQLASLSDAEAFANKDISGLTNNLHDIGQAAIVNLTADLAAKVAKASVHDTWETILGVAPGTNWAAAFAAGLDADAQSLLANLANSWLAVLQAAIGSGWAAKLAGPAADQFVGGVSVAQFGPGGGTWNKPANAKAVLVEVQAGGGGSGGVAATSATSVAQASGGGGGGYCRKLFAASALGATEAVVVGSGGAAGASTPTGGGDGGTSSFDVLSATGGQGGLGCQDFTTDVGTLGGAGGSGSGGDLNVTGDDGGFGLARVIPAGIRLFGDNFGGGSQLAGQTRAGGAVSAGAGAAGELYGGGAAAPSNGQNGPARTGQIGGAGVVYVITFA